MNNPESCVQEVTVSGSICQNHFLVVAVSVTVKHVVKGIEMVLGIDFSFVHRHGRHTKTRGQRCLLDLKAER